MENKPVVSVVTPVYNREVLVIETIESVLSQTFSDWELVLVDDGSTDNSRATIERYLDNPKVKYHYQENQGQSAARNKGIELATGKFIAFLDSDDIWLPEFLEVSLDELTSSPEFDLVHSKIICIDEVGNELYRPKQKKFSGDVTLLLLRDSFVSFSTVVVAKSFIDQVGGFDPNVRLAADYDLVIKLSVYCKFKAIDKRMIKYRVMENQISSDLVGRFRYNELIIKNFRQSNPSALSPLKWRIGFSQFYHRKARFELSRKEYRLSLISILASAGYFPFWAGPYRAFTKLIYQFLFQGKK